MSDTKEGTHQSQQIRGESMPKALVHKKILDAAREHPEASIEKLATVVDGASKQLVERVLDQYGDPADTDIEATDVEEAPVEEDDSDRKQSTPVHEQDQAMEQSNFTSVNSDGTLESTNASVDESDQPAEDGASVEAEQVEGDPAQVGTNRSTDVGENEDQPVEPTAQPTINASEPTAEPDTGSESAGVERDEQVVPTLEEVTEKQRDVLQAIYQNPHATQGELAELFDVSRATISQRVNAIEGFEWTNRQEFVTTMFENDDIPTNSDGAESAGDCGERLDDLANRVAALERTFTDVSESRQCPFGSPELASKVIRACIESERITEDEEETIIAELIEAGRS